MVRAVLFDLDDTLLDHAGAAAAAVRALYAARKAQLDMDEGSFVARWNELTEIGMQAFAAGELTIPGQRRMRIRVCFGAHVSDAEADALFAAYLRVYEASWCLYDDVLPCLDRLGEVRLGIVTNGGRELQLKKLRAMKILDRFEVVVTPEPPLKGKPDLAIFHVAAEKMRIAPSGCLYVGDHLERDALASRRAGMESLWLVRDGLQNVAPEGVRVVSSLHAIQIP